MPPDRGQWLVLKVFELIQHGQNVFLAHEEDVAAALAFAVLVAGPGREQDGVADLHLKGAAGTDCSRLKGCDWSFAPSGWKSRSVRQSSTPFSVRARATHHRFQVFR